MEGLLWVACQVGSIFLRTLSASQGKSQHRLAFFGERWRHYRRTVERLKLEAWQFFQLSGPYSSHKDHAEAYRTFASRVEGPIQQEVDMYIRHVVRERETAKDKGQTDGA